MNDRDRPLLATPLLIALLLTLAAVLAPHLLRLPVWVVTLLAGCGIWRLLLSRKAWRMPPAWLRALLTLLAAGGIAYHHSTLLGRDAGTALLAVMTALKLLELRSRRDVLLVLYLAYFLILTQFFYSQSIPNALYLLATVWATTMLLIAVQHPSVPLRRHLHTAAITLGQAAPLMLILFVLFPRIPGPLWSLPDDAHYGQTGLSDHMSPGQISELSRSGAVAFRVEFEGAPPPREALYWRGPVLSDYDGHTWHRAPSTGAAPAEISAAAASIRYTVILQPTAQRWLLSLDRPRGSPEQALLNERLELVTRAPVNELQRYTLESTLGSTWATELSESERYRNLALPADRHPRARALGAHWRSAFDSDAEILTAAVRFFSTQPFTYTLTPPGGFRDSIDEFLFDTRRGFCEHYAAAFVVLLRAAGIPARVVTGYLGGEMNPVGNYMIVRQSDAHAWTEVWLEGQGWLRADPTGLVSPQRVELGLGDALPADEPVPAIARRSNSWTRQLRLHWDAVNQRWDRWVLAYGPQLQREVLSRIGLGEPPRMALALAAGLAVCLLSLAAVMLWPRRPSGSDQASRLYQRFCRTLAHYGLVRQPWETPTAFARRLGRACPALGSEAEAITSLYLQVRYGKNASPALVVQLRQALKTFKRSARRLGHRAAESADTHCAPWGHE